MRCCCSSGIVCAHTRTHARTSISCIWRLTKTVHSLTHTHTHPCCLSSLLTCTNYVRFCFTYTHTHACSRSYSLLSWPTLALRRVAAAQRNTLAVQQQLRAATEKTWPPCAVAPLRRSAAVSYPHVMLALLTLLNDALDCYSALLG